MKTLGDQADNNTQVNRMTRQLTHRKDRPNKAGGGDKTDRKTKTQTKAHGTQTKHKEKPRNKQNRAEQTKHTGTKQDHKTRILTVPPP